MGNSVPRTTKVIGIIGYARSGKDTVADYLVQQYGYKKLSFAGPLKDACKAIFDFSHEQLHGDLKEEKDEYWKISPRNALQLVGSDLFRNQFGKDIWIMALHKQLIKYSELGHDKFVISDVRFENEIDYLKHNFDTKIWKVSRTVPVHLRPKIGSHESEQADLLEYDYALFNSDTLDNLYKQVDAELMYTKTHNHDELYCMNCPECKFEDVNIKSGQNHDACTKESQRSGL